MRMERIDFIYILEVHLLHALDSRHSSRVSLPTISSIFNK